MARYVAQRFQTVNSISYIYFQSKWCSPLGLYIYPMIPGLSLKLLEYFFFISEVHERHESTPYLRVWYILRQNLLVSLLR
jgi:hypothetical protein